MSRLKQLSAASGLVLFSLVLATCKPIPYYLERVCKAYGTVTDASTGLPLESVEVILGTYEYSELTNGLGDYELELAEGTWELVFAREGFEPFSTSVTVSLDNPRVQVDAALTPIVAPPPVVPSLGGVWVGRDLPMASGGTYPMDLQLTLGADSVYQSLIYADIDLADPPLQPNSSSGTWTATESVITTTITSMYSGSGWVALDPPMSQAVPYALSANELTLEIDLSWDGIPDVTWILTRQ